MPQISRDYAACQTDLPFPRDREVIAARDDPGPGERILVGPIDLAALRAEREHRRGHHFLSHLRTDAYTGRDTRPHFRPGGRPT